MKKVKILDIKVAHEHIINGKEKETILKVVDKQTNKIIGLQLLRADGDLLDYDFEFIKQIMEMNDMLIEEFKKIHEKPKPI